MNKSFLKNVGTEKANPNFNNCINMTLQINSDSMNYLMSESVRTDGNVLLGDANALMMYFQMDSSCFRRLREGRLPDYAKQPFPVPIKFRGRNYWRLDEIRQWELAVARLQQLTIDKNDILDFLDILEILKYSLDTLKTVRAVVNKSLKALDGKLRKKSHSMAN